MDEVMKMTDNEIIKALGYCCNEDIDYGDDVCVLCSMKDEVDCTHILRKYTLELITRQQAEIEEIREINKNMKEDRPFLIAAVREVAIKEFAERLIATITINNTHDGYLDYAVDYNCLMEDINEISEEMIGGEDE